MSVCYRHSDRETGVSCSSCGRPICPDCMTPTPVGMRCPECARQRTKVRTRATLSRSAAPLATQAIIALNVIVFLAQTASGTPLGGASYLNLGTIYAHGALFGPSITQDHEYWRLLTAGFLHDGILHIAFNMLFIFFIGRSLEPAIGRINFVAVYLASLLAGSFGALLFQPHGLTVGASGAGFGLLGALIVLSRARGISIWESGLGPTLLLNLVFTLSISGISIGGHLGGLVGGLACGYAIVEWGERRRRPMLALAGCGIVALVSIAAAVAVAGGNGLTPNGFRF